MRIVIHSMGMPFGPTTVYEQSLGGSESAAFYLARELGSLGHQVELFTSRQAAPERVGNVNYQWHGQPEQDAPLGRDFEFYARNTPHDVLVVQRAPQTFMRKFAAKVCILQLHDLALRRHLATAAGATWQLDAITCVSKWHVEQVKRSWMINERQLFVVPNGVDPDLYVPSGGKPFVMLTDDEPGRHEENRMTLPRSKFNLLYQSRPERGLAHLVRPGGIMDRCRDLPVHLTFCGYDNTVPEMRAYYESLYQQAAALPNVSFVGPLTKPQLAELQRKCDVMVYPTEFEEVSCITAMEAMHAGLPMLSSRYGALPETCDKMGSKLFDLKEGKADEDAFVAWLSTTLKDRAEYPGVLSDMRDAQFAASLSRTWKDATQDLLAVIDTCFSRRYGSPAAVLRSAIERSDIDFAKWYYHESMKVYDVAIGNPIIQSSISELLNLYSFTESDDAYAAHYAKHQGIYYDGPGAKAVGEDVTGSSRFRGVRHLMEQALTRPRDHGPPRVLDYGCAHGHYTFPLQASFPAARFHGVDISERAIGAAQEYRDSLGMDFPKFKVGAEDYLFDRARMADEDKFDVILAGEVLEHARDWRRLLDLLRRCLRPGGALIITTPFGRWEHSGTEAFRTGREHLVHFERADIEDICKGHEVEIMTAPAGSDRSEELLGSYLWMVTPKEGVPFGDIDYMRKRLFYAPRETISLCMIVKDGEKTLRKCIESVVDWVDEVCVSIDPSTTDRTSEILFQLKMDFLNRPFVVKYLPKPVLESGFDAARNASIEGASGDWILWCDADEEVHGAPLLHKLARPSAHDGFGFAQIHYALDPPQVLTTDYPTRFFRNGRGIKFYGVVHEHPELTLGEAIPTSVPRPEVKFLHCGYVDEGTRRNRYLRNFPLLERDREAYPTRKLNQFLWLRDLAQGMLFEQERTGVTERHLKLAEDGIKLFEQMLDSNPPPKMLSDCLPYYAHCVATLGRGFDAEVNFKTVCVSAPNMNVQSVINGRFHTRQFFQRLVAYFLEESTKTYEDTHL